MAVYTTLFLARVEALARDLPNWRPALAEPVASRVRNPFTGVEAVVLSYELPWDEAAPIDAASEEPEDPSPEDASDDSYERYLEVRLPRFARRRPHVCLKGLTSIEFGPLLVACGIDPPELRPAFYAHPESSATLDRFPDELVRRSSDADDEELVRLARRWGESPELRAVYEDDEAASFVLGKLRELIREAGERDGLFLLAEW